MGLVLTGWRGRGPLPGGAHARMARLIGAALLLSAVAIGVASCTSAVAQPPRPRDPLPVTTHLPGPATSVLAGTPDAVTAGVARQLFASAPVVVVASTGRPDDLAAAATRASRAHAPLLLTTPQAGLAAGGAAALRAGIRVLHPHAILLVGVPAQAPSAQLPGIRLVSDPGSLPLTSAPAPLRHVVLLVHQGDSSEATMAAVTTAHAAGAQVITVRGYDPMTDPAAITALAAAKPHRVLAIGPKFGPPSRLAYRLAVAETGVQLPGGGQVLFPMHRLVALYGHPGDPALGALGQQDLPASVARAKKLARQYRRLSSVPVVPAFEIIATVAEAHPGPDGTYSYASPLSLLRPWVARATAAGMYVVLDLQAGRASLLAQAKRYAPLLMRPNVGLALDPEWKLGPRQLPLKQIGSVTAGQINGVSRWLAGLTARHHLPQKLLVLHQFRPSMITNERWLDTHHGNLAIVIHMDGQGTPRDKQQTWNAVTRAAPPGVFFGWKNFFTKDHPMLGPRQTMARSPKPVMISYQ
jgi:hypothetical protein